MSRINVSEYSLDRFGLLQRLKNLQWKWDRLLADIYLIVEVNVENFFEFFDEQVIDSTKVTCEGHFKKKKIISIFLLTLLDERILLEKYESNDLSLFTVETRQSLDETASVSIPRLRALNFIFILSKKLSHKNPCLNRKCVEFSRNNFYK